jgi:hypothetical protein
MGQILAAAICLLTGLVAAALTHRPAQPATFRPTG